MENKGVLRKYVFVYIILFAVLIIIFLTHGIPNGIILHEEDNREWMYDGSIVTWTLLIYNTGIIFACFIVSIITTSIKGNRIRFKWLIPVVMLIISIVFLPTVQIRSFRGINGQDIYKGYYSSIGIYLGQTFNGNRMETSRQSSSGGTYVTPVENNQD